MITPRGECHGKGVRKLLHVARHMQWQLHQAHLAHGCHLGARCRRPSIRGRALRFPGRCLLLQPISTLSHPLKNH